MVKDAIMVFVLSILWAKYFYDRRWWHEGKLVCVTHAWDHFWATVFQILMWMSITTAVISGGVLIWCWVKWKLGM